MAVITRATNNNNAGRNDPPRRNGKEPVRNPTPDGFLEDMDEDYHPEGENSVSSGERSTEPQREQPDMLKAVQDFLELRREEFNQFFAQTRGPEGSKSRETVGSSQQPRSGERRQVSSQRASARREYPSSVRDNVHHTETPRRDRRSPPRNDDRGRHHAPVAEPYYTGGFNTYGRLVTPFSEDIVRADLPDRYKTPNISYNGLCNPENFLGQFQYSMMNQKLNEVHMCKLFPELLIDNARTWFDSLPPGSITSYQDLMAAFHRRFFQKAASKTTSAHLLTIRQGRDEHISDFMTRFNQESLKVADINDLLVISAFQNGILPGALYRELVRNEPRTVTELWNIAERFAKADDADRMKREADRPHTSERKKREDDRGDQGRNRRSVHDRIQRGTLQSRLGPQQSLDRPRPSPQFTPLTRSRAEIYELHSDLFEKPRPMTRSSKRRPRDKYCSYHEDHGHETENCRDLAAGIESLVKDGSLRKYQERAQGQGRGRKRQARGRGTCALPEKKTRQDPEDDDDVPQFDGVVTTITGLPVDKTRTSLKTEARSSHPEEPAHKRFKKDEAITFSSEDPVPTMVPHQDPLVIQAGVANKLVHRVFVDSGASVSILFKDCFDKLELEEARMSPSPLPLRSFTQQETRPEGVIGLPVTVGKAPASSSTVVQFFVVKASSPYNIILGRDWLNAVRAVCSTYHLMIKIPTKGGVVTIRGDQKRAKECTLIALRGSDASAPQA